MSLLQPKITNLCRTFGTKSNIQNVTNVKVVINNQNINYIRVGTGSKNILCFPGALGSIWNDFKPQIEFFDKDKFTVVVWDPPGYGLSRPPARKFSSSFYKDDAEMAYDFMRTLRLKSFSLLGWSDGGISSMILSAIHPEVVEKLVIWGSNAYVLPEDILLYEKIRDIKNWSERAKAPLIQLYSEEGFQKLWSGWCDTLISLQNNGGDICKNLLPQIKCPTLILHGDKDPMIAPEHPQYLLSHIEGSKLHRFPDGKHNIHLRYSDEFNYIVSKFLMTNTTDLINAKY